MNTNLPLLYIVIVLTLFHSYSKIKKITKGDRIYVYQKSFNQTFQTGFESKSLFKFLFSSCEFTKVILQSKSWNEMFVLKLSGIQIVFHRKFNLTKNITFCRNFVDFPLFGKHSRLLFKVYGNLKYFFVQRNI